MITSARYENGVTTISGHSLAGNNSRQVLLYANTSLEPGGLAEGEQYLGSTSTMLGAQTTFTLTFNGDLRGKYVNGVSFAAVWWYDEAVPATSEFGRAVRVE